MAGRGRDLERQGERSRIRIQEKALHAKGAKLSLLQAEPAQPQTDWPSESAGNIFGWSSGWQTIRVPD